MAVYKGIEIDDALTGSMRHMQGVEDYREVLGKLQAAWDTLALLGQLTGAATEMTGTREAFERLTGDLLNRLGQETRRKAIAELRAKAQTSIDILVRNLFERTADIGFLAADDDIREFLQGAGETREALEARFHEYVQKYSVYADIVLFRADGRIAARLMPGSCEASAHPLLDDARSTTSAYVEYYGPADFLAPGQHLLYAYRVEDAAGECLGILALHFRLEDEMRSIFANLTGTGDSCLLANFDSGGLVVATSSPLQLPAGTQLDDSLRQARGDVVRLAGREYLAIACAAHPYQGYPGPGWCGLAMVPLEFAFERRDSELLKHIDSAILQSVAHQPKLFNDELRLIPQQAERIQEDLNRSVWNGSVRQVDNNSGNAAFAKTLLWEISSTGRKTQAVFEQSIGNLHETVVAALLQNGISRAAFAIDVMDRNLYERANDCRWWALNATFRRVLSEPRVSPEDAVRCGEILRYINGLYTVYANLILYDAHGQVIAVSDSEQASLCGTRLHEEWVGRSLALDNSQGYVCSHFAPTPLYGNRHTYIYAAAIRDPQDSRVVGGIGIVFDGQPQFAAMLNDALPRDAAGQPIAGTFALFAQRDGRIVASSDPRFAIGSTIALSASQRQLGRGGRMADIITQDEHYFALGTAVSAGYREYKTSDGHSDEILALSAFPLGKAGAVSDDKRRNSAPAVGNRARRLGNGGDCIEIATFFIGRQWLGIPATDVIEAIDADDLTPVFGGRSDLVAGVKMYRGNLISVVHLARLLQPGAPIPERVRQIVVVRTHGKTCLGLLVDELGEIPEIARDEIKPVNHMAAAGEALTVGIVEGMRRSEDRHGLLSILASDRLCHRIGCHCETPEAPRTIELAIASRAGPA